MAALVPWFPPRHNRRSATQKMLISVGAIACSLLVRPPAVPLYRTPTPARLSSPQMATEELVEQFVDWVRLSKPCRHTCALATTDTPHRPTYPNPDPNQLEGGPGTVFRTSSELEGDAAKVLVPMRVLAGVLMIHHGSEGGLGPANFGTGGEGSPAAPVPAPALATTTLTLTLTLAHTFPRHDHHRRHPPRATRQASTVSSRTC